MNILIPYKPKRRESSYSRCRQTDTGSFVLHCGVLVCELFFLSTWVQQTWLTRTQWQQLSAFTVLLLGSWNSHYEKHTIKFSLQRKWKLLVIGMKCDRGEQESTERTPVHHTTAVMFKLWGTGESKGAAICLALACDTQLYAEVPNFRMYKTSVTYHDVHVCS